MSLRLPLRWGVEVWLPWVLVVTGAVATITSIALAVAEQRDVFVVDGLADSTAEGTRVEQPQPIRQPLKQAGDICDSCLKFQQHRKAEPKRLVHVFDGDGNVMKTDRGTEIVVCPYCDGDLILKLSKGD